MTVRKNHQEREQKRPNIANKERSDLCGLGLQPAT